MGELRGSFVELQPTHSAMLFQVICHTGFGDAQVLSQGLLQSRRIFCSATATNDIADGNSEGLARFDVVVTYLVGIRKQENTRSGRRRFRLLQF